VISFALALLAGFGLNQGADSAVFTAALIGVAVLMIGMRRVRTARRGDATVVSAPDLS
jgi:hypothetical protein